MTEEEITLLLLQKQAALRAQSASQTASRQAGREQAQTPGGRFGEGISRVVEGMTGGLAGDEMNAFLSAPFRGQGDTFGEKYNDRLEFYRGSEEQFREDKPGLTTALEVGGALSTALIPGAGQANLGRAAAVAGAGAATNEFMEGEGGFENRLDGVPTAAATGALFALGLGAAARGGSRAAKKALTPANQRVQLEDLKVKKTKAYKAADDIGEVFTKDEMGNLYDTVLKKMSDPFASYQPVADKDMLAVLNTLKRTRNTEPNISRLDKLRQGFWDRYRKSDDPNILTAIRAIDDLIDTRADLSAAMGAARDANKVYRKFEMLDSAFQKAADEAESTGSGGNVANKYRQAVSSIVNNRRAAQFFSEDEIGVMRQFLRDNPSDRALRRFGKLSPGGNGLMLTLGAYSSLYNPATLGLMAAGAGSKAVADQRVLNQADEMVQAFGRGTLPTPPSSAVPALSTSGAFAGANQVNRDPRQRRRQ